MVDVRSVIPIKYMGSKSRIAKYIVPILQKEIDDNHINVYIEPFCGGCNTIDKIKCDRKIANDYNPYLIALLEHVANGGGLPESVPKELYDKARAIYYKIEKAPWQEQHEVLSSSEFELWELGAIGFLASYNARFYDGGYAKSGYEKTKNGLRYRDYYREAKDNLIKQVPLLKDIAFRTGDYRCFTVYPSPNEEYRPLIYCDPPYTNTKQFFNSQNFDYDDFWETMRIWSRKCIVYISELQAPDDFECVWEHEVSRSIKATDKSRAVEKLFRYKGE